jgi:mRNA interferase MazF
MGKARGQGNVVAAYVPDRGDLIKIDFDPGAGHEQSGWRPVLVLSPASYNRPTGLAIVVPVANKQKGYPFEVILPAGLKAPGAVLSDAIKNVDWRVRNARYLGPATPAVLVAVQERLGLLLGLEGR